MHSFPQQRSERSLGSATFESQILATGYALPSDIVDNDTFFARCRFPITEDRDALIQTTQMKTRAWCLPEENTWTLAREAVKMALAEDASLRDQIDVVIVASGTTMPIFHPPTRENAGMADLAPLILQDLGRERVLGFDIKACYCTGFLRGLEVADALLRAGGYRAALVVASEQGSRFAVAETNRSSVCFIMSDAAGAVVLGKRPAGERAGILDSIGYTAADKLDWVGIGPDAVSNIMKGSRAGAAVRELLIECARALLARNGISPDDVRWLLPIQTHAQVIDSLCTALEWPREKLLWFGDVTGFSGSASIPACLAQQIRRGVVRKGDLILSVAVGAGLNCAGTLYSY